MLNATKFPLAHPPLGGQDKVDDEAEGLIEEAIRRLRLVRTRVWIPSSAAHWCRVAAYWDAVKTVAERYPTASSEMGEWLHPELGTRLADWNENIEGLYLRRYPRLRDRLGWTKFRRA